jgi:hypothetical protein
MSSTKKSITGTDDLLRKVFDSPEMDDVVARMKRVQSSGSKSTALKPVRKPTGRASDNPSDNVLSHGLSDAMSDAMSDYPTDYPTDCPSDSPSDNPTDSPTNYPTHGPTHYPTDYPTDYPTVGTTGYPAEWKNKVADPVWALTHKQAKVLFYLVNQPDSIAQRERISRETEIPVPTVKHCIKVLSADGFISKPTKYVNRSFQGFSYTVNQGLCRQFIEKRGHEFAGMKNYPSHYPTLYPTDCPTVDPTHYPTLGMSHGLSDGLSDHYSSSIESKTTTTDFETLLKTDPELGYWQEKGLQCQQVLKWMEETGMTGPVMLQSLKHCRFDMVDRDIEETKPVQNVFNWFYSIIKRSGHYPKPTGYRSWNEKMIEIEQSLLDEQEAEIRRMEELRTRRYRLEAERKFQEMMNDPDGETYKAVYARLSTFEKQLGSGLPFEKAMRSRFEEFLTSTASQPSPTLP